MSNLDDKNYRNLDTANNINANMKYQNNTMGNANEYTNTHMNPQILYDRNRTNMANLNTIVQATKEDVGGNKAELRNTYNAKQLANSRGELDAMKNANINKTKLSEGEKQGVQHDTSGHHMHGKKKKKCSIL